MTATEFSDAARRVARGVDHHNEARRLVELMTRDEKLGCLDGDTPFWPGITDMMNGGYTSHPWPAAVVERLGIPGIQFSDGPRGCVCTTATAFPVSMARGASFDPVLERRVGDAIGRELRAAGATYTGAVCMNLLRHPAWGRAQETYGEDPLHVGVMAEALTLGLQGHVMACMKHFALNSMENARFTVDVTVGERALHEVYLPHFKRVADAGIASVMSAYNSVNGEWCGQNATLLLSILREEWDWDGFVTSDFLFGLRDAVKSVVAGLNIEMPFAQQRAMVLHEATDTGILPMAVVDQRVREIVATLLRFHYVFSAEQPQSVLACVDHRNLAYEASVASMVLLRNERLLPVAVASLARVAVLGRLAAVANLGDGGSSNVFPPSVITPLDGLRVALPHVVVDHADTDAAIAVDADLVVVVVGYTKFDEGEWLDRSTTAALSGLFPPIDHPTLGFPATPGQPDPAPALRPAVEDHTFAAGGDRRSLRLSAEDEALIRAATEANSRVVVVVMSGSAVVMPWLEEARATLLVWYPGMEGGRALADVLLGRAEPSGRLPFAIPTDASQLVHFDADAATETYELLHGQWWLDHNNTPAHRPFGFGLGYTTFAVESARSTFGAGLATVQATVRNTGSRRGSGVVQVYGSVADGLLRPPQRLVGFQKVTLDPGDAVEVEVSLHLDGLNTRNDGAMRAPEAPVKLTVGLHANDANAVLLDDV